MKNYYLIVGGIAIGLGIASLKKEESNITPILTLLGGTAVILMGIYGFKTK